MSSQHLLGLPQLAGEDQSDQDDGVFRPLPRAEADHEGPRRGAESAAAGCPGAACSPVAARTVMG